MFEALGQNVHVRDNIRRVLNEVRQTPHHLTRNFPDRGALTFEPVVDDRDNQRQRGGIDVVVEVGVQNDLQAALRLVKRIAERPDQQIDPVGDFRVLNRRAYR